MFCENNQKLYILLNLWQVSEYAHLSISTHELVEWTLLLLIQTYSGIFTSYSDISSHIVAYLEPCVTLAYSEPCHIQNPVIFRTWDIFRTLSRHILAYLERWVTYWEPCHIQHFVIFRKDPRIFGTKSNI